MQRIFATTLYSRIIVKCNVLNQNFIIETNEIFIEFMEFLSLKMRPTKLYLHFCCISSLQMFRRMKWVIGNVCMYVFLCVVVHTCQSSTIHLPPHPLFKHPHPSAILAYFLQVPIPTPTSPCGRHKSMIPYC